MPRKLVLTFQKGANNRAGRWKKRYQGITHYLGYGPCKTDRASYLEALSAWKKLKLQIDTNLIAQPNPLEREYQKVIEEWELVLGWSVQHHEDDEAAIARTKLSELRERLSASNPSPVTDADRLWNRFRPDSKLLLELADSALARPDSLEEFREAMLSKPGQFVDGATLPDNIDEPNPWRLQQIKWEDRIESQKRQLVNVEDQSLGQWVQTYLARQRQRVEADELSAGRFESGRSALEFFRDWAGSSVQVEAICGQTLTRFHAHLLELVSQKKCKPSYARDRMTTVRTLVRWLWEQDAITELPKNVNSKNLRFSSRTTTPEVLSIEEVATLLQKSVGRTRLYVLLGLNCGMSQKDISDLKQTDIDWARGRITRKRSKTKDHEGVPTVTYQLWPETIELLIENRSSHETVLVNRNGSPLVLERIGASGKYQKNDNVKNAYERLLKTAAFRKPFKLLRKTSATLIHGDERFRGLDQLFLGHAPSSIAERHYTAISESALDNALVYLRQVYEIEKNLAVVSAPLPAV